MTGPAPAANALAVLVARQAIVDVTVRYATALDTRQWRLLDSVFTADARVRYQIPGVGLLVGPAAVAGYMAQLFAGLRSTQHCLSNHEVVVDGARATSTCYLVSTHYRAHTHGGPLLTIGATYHDELVDTDEGWRIVHRRAVGTWRSGNLEVLGWGRRGAAARTDRR